MAGASPYAVRLDPDTARELAASGATLLFLDVPAGTHIGIDHQAFTSGPNFKGVKMLPPGPHFVSCCPAGDQGDVAPPTSTFLHLAPKQVVVRRWDPQQELLLPLLDEDEERRYAEGVRRFDFDSGLAPYNLAQWPQWQQLSGHLTQDVISKLLPVGGGISVMAEAQDLTLEQPRTEAEARLVQQLQAAKLNAAAGGEGAAGASQAAGSAAGAEPTTAAAAGAEARQAAGPPSTSAGAASAAAARPQHRCFYTELPRLVKGPGLSPAQLTALNLDKSALLAKLAGQRYGGRLEGLLAELQFAFVAFVYGQSLDGFRQWKALLQLWLGCEEAPLSSHQQEYVLLLRAVRAQLQQGLGAGQAGMSPLGVPLVEELLPDSFLRHGFVSLLGLLQECQEQVGPELWAEAEALRALLRSSLGWDFSLQLLEEGCEGEDEYAPVVVELPEGAV